MKYNIGQILTLNKDVELRSELTNKTRVKKAGTKLFVSASQKPKMAMYFSGEIDILPDDTEVEGYSTEGIAEWLYIWLRNEFEIDEFLDDYEIEVGEFKEEIADALEELGMYDNTGNRS